MEYIPPIPYLKFICCKHTCKKNFERIITLPKRQISVHSYALDSLYSYPEHNFLAK